MGQVFTGSDGMIANGAAASRRWTLNGAQVSVAQTYVSTAAGTLVFEVTATGPGGATVGASSAVTVGAALPIGLSGWRALAANAKAGISGGKIATVGDSTTAGTGASLLTASYPYKLYQALLAAGVPVAFDACCGQPGHRPARRSFGRR